MFYIVMKVKQGVIILFALKRIWKIFFTLWNIIPKTSFYMPKARF